MPDEFSLHLKREKQREIARLVDGRPYHEHVAAVKTMRRAGNLDEAAGLLLRLIDAVEREAAIPLAGRVCVAPWYYRELAAIYRRLKMTTQAELVLVRLQVQNAKAAARGEAATKRLRAASAGEDDAKRSGSE